MRDQIIVRVGRAPGMVPDSDALTARVSAGLVSRFEVNPGDVTFYLMGMRAGESRALPVRFTATLAMNGTIPGSNIYAYYEPSIRTEVPAQALVVAP